MATLCAFPAGGSFRKMEPVARRTPATTADPAGGSRRTGWVRGAAVLWIALVALGYAGAVIADLGATGRIELPFAGDGWRPLGALQRAGRAAGGLGVLLLAAIGAGAVLRRFIMGRSRQGRFDGLVWSAVTGLGAAATALAGLGFAGLFRSGVLWGAAAAGITAGVVELRRRGRRPRPAPRHPPGGIRRCAGWWSLTAVAWLVQVAAGLAPATEIDSLTYHLGKAQLFLREGRIRAPADNVTYHLPSLWEVQLGWVERPGAAGPVPAGYALLTALLLRVALRRHGERAGALAALLFVSSWPVLSLAGSAKNDLAVALFGLAAFMAARQAGTRRVALAGTLLGFGLATKPTAVYAVPVVAITAILSARTPRGSGRRLAWGLLAAASVAAPWGVRAWLDDGNPLYPVAGSRPGGPGPAALDLIRRERYGYARASYASWTDRLRAPWSLAATEGKLVLPALALPALLLALGRAGPVRPWAGAALGLTAIWACGPPNPRFLLQALPAWCAAVALLAAPGGARPSLAALCTMLASLELARSATDPLLDLSGRLRVAAGGEGPAAYLERRLPGYAHAVQWANERLPRSARVLFHGELRSVPLDRRGTAPSVAEPFEFLNLAAASRDRGRFAIRMRQTGATHLLANRTTAVFRRHGHAPLLPGFRAFELWAGWWSRRAALVYEAPVFTAREGAHYLYALDGSAGAGPGPLLPGIEGWLAEPERLAAGGRWPQARGALDRIRAAAGEVPLLDHAEATILGPVLPPARRRLLLHRAERGGLRAVSLYEALADLADRDRRPADARRYRALAAALDPLADRR